MRETKKEVYRASGKPLFAKRLQCANASPPAPRAGMYVVMMAMRAVHVAGKVLKKGSGTGRNRTADTRIFSPVLYQLSYRTSKRFCESGGKFRPVFSNSHLPAQIFFSTLHQLADDPCFLKSHSGRKKLRYPPEAGRAAPPWLIPCARSGPWTCVPRHR